MMFGAVVMVGMFSILSLNRGFVPSMTVTKLVIKEPSGNPVWATVSRLGEAPIVAGMWVAGLGNALHSLVFGLLNDIAPVVRGFPLAILLQMKRL
jgi:hypothetical protein